MAKIRRGDEAALGELILRHQEGVYRLARRMVGRPEDARDIAQDLFLKIWEEPSGFKPTARFTTWLYRVTTNRAISHLRARRLKSLLTFSDYDPSDYIAANPDERPDSQVVHSDEQEQLARELMRLPPRQRAAVHLRYREDLSVADVAAALRVSVKSAESLLFRAKTTLRARLANT